MTTTVEDETIVQFPRLLNTRRVKDLLAQIAKNTGTKVEYFQRVRGHIDEMPFHANKTKKREEYTSSISGLIRAGVSGNYATINFKLDRGGKSITYFDKFSFEIAPYDLDELPRESHIIMHGVKGAIDEYFAKHPGFQFKKSE